MCILISFFFLSLSSLLYHHLSSSPPLPLFISTSLHLCLSPSPPFFISTSAHVYLCLHLMSISASICLSHLSSQCNVSVSVFCECFVCMCLCVCFVCVFACVMCLCAVLLLFWTSINEASHVYVNTTARSNWQREPSMTNNCWPSRAPKKSP